MSEKKEKEREEGGGEEARIGRLVEFAVNLSLAVNVCLFIAKIFAARASGSRAVLATMLDSFVDLMSQMVIFFAEWSKKRHDPLYPVGKSRLETIGVIVSAGIMSFSAMSVLQTSLMDLISAEHEVDLPCVYVRLRWLARTCGRGFRV
jgi:divalent metal cation (Fe/Co/Zn/Cd) transporter